MDVASLTRSERAAYLRVVQTEGVTITDYANAYGLLVNTARKKVERLVLLGIVRRVSPANSRRAVYTMVT